MLRPTSVKLKFPISRAFIRSRCNSVRVPFFAVSSPPSRNSKRPIRSVSAVCPPRWLNCKYSCLGKIIAAFWPSWFAVK